MTEASEAAALVYDSDDEYRPEPEPEPQPPPWCDGSVRIGIHTSIAGDIVQALESASKLGSNALQIFSGSPRMWLPGRARIAEADAARFRARRAELALGPLVIHANYLINLAASEPVMRARSIQAFHEEILRALALGADFLVVHPGSAGNAKPTHAIEAVAEALRQAARGIRFESGRRLQRQSGGLTVLLENTAGMGSCLGCRFEELRAMLDAAPELPLGICLDTAHAFQAGYDIRSEAGLEGTLEAFDAAVGLARLRVVHPNDSKTAFGSRVDRHQHLGRGAIGKDALRRLLTHPRLSARPPHGVAGRAFILETPIDQPGDDRKNVRTTWQLAGLAARQAPRAEDGFSMRRGAAAPPKAAAKSRSAGPRRKAERAKPASRPRRAAARRKQR